MKQLIFGLFAFCLVLGSDACGNDDGGEIASNDADSDSDSDSDTVDDTNPDGYLVNENFDEYKAGNTVAAAAGGVWTVWQTPQGQDAEIVDELASGKPNSVVIRDVEDIVLVLDLDSGKYQIDFKMYVSEGKLGYYNFLAKYTGGKDCIWAFSVNLYAGGVGSVNVAGEMYDFTFLDGVWTEISHIIDFDADTATVSINGDQVVQWMWSIAQGSNGNGTLEGINFCAVSDPPGSEFYIDDVTIKQL